MAEIAPLSEIANEGFVPPPLTHATRDGLVSHLLADGAVVLVVLAWWLMSRRLPPIVLPDPWSVAVALAEFFYDPELLHHVAATSLRVVESVIAATVIGAGLAILPYYVPVLQDVILRRVQPFLGAMPSVGWAILGVIWFDVSDFAVVFIQTAILVPFCLINISQGLSELDAELIEMGRSYTRARRRVFAKLIFPLLLPYAVAAARMAYGVCWKVALVSELFGSDTGLGYVMFQAQILSDATTVLATCLAIVVLFTLGDFLLLRPLARLVSH